MATSTIEYVIAVRGLCHTLFPFGTLYAFYVCDQRIDSEC